MKQQQNPSWIFSFLSEKFFNPCAVHDRSKKNEKNIFCLDCCITICSHCVNFHRPHLLLQVRRYVYHDVIRLDDMEKLFDCSFVQSYTTNNAKVIFLNQRPQTRPLKGSGSVCNTCDRSLQELYQFCSLACKVQYIVAYEGCISRYLYDCDYLALSDLAYAQFEGGKELDDGGEGDLTPSSVLLDGGDSGGGGGEMMITMLSSSSGSYRTSSGSSSTTSTNININDAHISCLTLACTATTENVTRKKRSTSTTTAKLASGGNVCSHTAPRPVCKRKGLPLRSPLF